jgi:NarL family two-component system response regulator LiaR
MRSEKIRVLIVDDHEMVRQGIAVYLKVTPDIELVGEAGDGQEAIDLCEKLKPDVVLMDLIMPRMDGVTATREIRSHYPKTQVLALTSFQERDLVKDAIQAGALSYLLKNISGSELAVAIRSAAEGRPSMAPEVTQDLILNPVEPTPGQDLTQREKEVLTLMVEGLSNPQIAERLYISRSTARAHVSNILAKLNVTRRAEAVALALRKKLIK